MDDFCINNLHYRNRFANPIINFLAVSLTMLQEAEYE